MQTTHTRTEDVPNPRSSQGLAERGERRSVLRRVLLALVGLLAAAGCSDGGSYTVERTRTARASDPPVIPGITTAERFGWRPQPGEEGRAQMTPQRPPAPPPLIADLPEAWERVPETQFRQINTRVAASPEAECYLTFLPGDGGGDLANVNRWRSELALAPIDAAAVTGLPRTQLIGQPALRVDFTGNFTGMGGQQIAEARLLGVLLTRPNMPGALFVKFVGPAAVVAEHEANFDSFVGSVRLNENAAGVDANPTSSAGLTWQVPPTWTAETAPRSMREVTLTKGKCELYVSVLGGGGGGVLANVNRWLGQFDAPSLGVEGLAALERAPCLGGEAVLVTAEGAFGGMSGAKEGGMGLLGAVLEQPSRLVTVKLTGPAAEVAAERANFLSFLASLAEAP